MTWTRCLYSTPQRLSTTAMSTRHSTLVSTQHWTVMAAQPQQWCLHSIQQWCLHSVSRVCSYSINSIQQRYGCNTSTGTQEWGCSTGPCVWFHHLGSFLHILEWSSGSQLGLPVLEGSLPPDLRNKFCFPKKWPIAPPHLARGPLGLCLVCFAEKWVESYISDRRVDFNATCHMVNICLHLCKNPEEQAGNC